MKKGHKFYFQFYFCGFRTPECPADVLSQPARGGRGWGAGRRRRRDRFQAQKGRLAHLVGARPTWGVNQCAARPAAQRRVRPALRGLPALPPLRHAVPHFRLQGLTCDPGPANQRTPPLRDGAGQPQLGQSEPSLESGEGRPSPWVPRCLKPEAPMDAPSQKPAGSPSCLPFKRRLSWVGILSVAREGALHRLRASGPPPGVPWEAGLCWRPGPFSTSHRATEPPEQVSGKGLPAAPAPPRAPAGYTGVQPSPPPRNELPT